MMPEDEELIKFKEFHQRVGEAEYTVRRALRELGIRPIPLLHDLRHMGYKPEWVTQVRQWIDERLRSGGA